MTILIRCGGCRQKHTVPSKMVGKRVKCQRCGSPIDVPANGPSYPPVVLEKPIIVEPIPPAKPVWFWASVGVVACMPFALIALVVIAVLGPDEPELQPNPSLPAPVERFLPHPRRALGSFPLPQPKLPVGWQRVKIPEVGTIDIPPTMEVQKGTYAKLSRDIKRPLLKDSDNVTVDTVIIQQKGVNAFDATEMEYYVRIIVTTYMGKAGDYKSLDARHEVTPDEIRELSAILRAHAEKFPYGKILQLDTPTGEIVNGMQTIRFSYRRQYKNNLPVRVTGYNPFQNHDRMHTLTMSYREAERDKWLPDLPVILSSFRITNVRGPLTHLTPNAIPADDPMTLVFGDHWVLTLICSAIVTWGIGLAPPLLTRFAFMRERMSKGGAIAFVAVFFFVNVALFTALGSQSKTHSALIFVACASYYILIWRAKTSPKEEGRAAGQALPLR